MLDRNYKKSFSSQITFKSTDSYIFDFKII